MALPAQSLPDLDFGDTPVLPDLDFGDTPAQGEGPFGDIQANSDEGSLLGASADIGEMAVGGAEAAAAMVTGIPSMVSGFLRGTSETLATQDPKAFGPGMEKGAAVFEGLGYQPRTKTGQAVVSKLGEVMHAYSSGVDWLAEQAPTGLFIGDEGTPGQGVLPSAVKIAGEALPFVVGPKAAKGKARPAKPREPAPTIPDSAGEVPPIAEGPAADLVQAKKPKEAIKYYEDEAAVVPETPPEGVPPVSEAPSGGAPPLEPAEVLVSKDKKPAARRAKKRAAEGVPPPIRAKLEDAGLPMPGSTVATRPTARLDTEKGMPHERVEPLVDKATETLVKAIEKEVGLEAEAAEKSSALAEFIKSEEGSFDVGALFGKKPKPTGAGAVTEKSFASEAREAKAEAGAKGMRLRTLDVFQSPKMLARRLKPLMPYAEAGQSAKRVQQRLSGAFNKRLMSIEKALSDPAARWTDRGQALRENKAAMNDLLVQGDLAGRQFTRAELLQAKIKPEVIEGYMLTRQALNEAWTMMHRYRTRLELDTGKRGGYVPHSFHDYFVRGRAADGTLTDLASYKTLKEARDAAEKLSDLGHDVLVAPKMFRWDGAAQQAVTVGDNSYFKLRDNIENVFGVDKDAATQLLNDVAKPTPKARFLGNLMERKGQAGWEHNMDHVLRGYFNGVSRYMALDPFKRQSVRKFEREFGKFGDQHKGLAGYVKNYINDVNGVPNALDTWFNEAIMSNKTLGPLAEKWLGPNAVQAMAHGTTKAVAVAKLGMFNLSAALVNGSQAILANAIIGPQYLAEGLAASVHLSPQSKGILKQVGVERGGQGFFEAGEGGAGMGKIAKAFETTLVAFSEAEYRLRSATSLGAYKRAWETGQTHREAIAYAREVNERVNFDYGTAAAPSAFRQTGALGQVALQFKKYPLKSFEFLRSLEGAEHARFWVPYLAMSGMTGVPVTPAFSNLAQFVTGFNPELEGKQYIMNAAGPENKEWAHALMYGAAGAAGIDVSARVRTGDVLPQDPTKFADVAGFVGGAAASTAVRVWQSAGQEAWLQALRDISPGIGNPLQAIMNDGIITRPWDRDRLVRELTPVERVVKATGFKPVSESVEQDVSRIIKYETRANQADKGKAIAAWVRGMAAEDDAAVEKALDKFFELGGSGRTLKAELKKQGMTLTARQFGTVPKSMRADFLPLLEFSE